MSYTAYITRDGIEYEVSAELYEDGVSHTDSWKDTGRNFEIEKDPIFHEFYVEDRDGVELILTSQELTSVNGQLIERYWDIF